MNYTRIHNHIIDIMSLNPDKRSGKGWIMSSESCPWCGKDDEHFGIRLNNPNGRFNNHISFHCFKCDEKGGEYKLLRALDQLHILEHGDYIDHSKDLEKRVLGDSGFGREETTSQSPTMSKPLGYRRVKSDEYLDSRGFESWQYDLYSVGRTMIDRRLKDYVIFLIMEDGRCRGNVSRSVKSKEWIKKYNDEVKEFNANRLEGVRKKAKYLRYRNDEAEFDKLLMGIDEITPRTKVVLLVEGVMDKANVDRLLRLHEDYAVKCLCTFGKKISDEQIEKLNRKGPNVSTVILIYDPDAMEDSKDVGDRLSQVFRNTLVGFTKDNDPGDMDLDELNSVIDNAESPLNFRVNKVQKKKLL